MKRLVAWMVIVAICRPPITLMAAVRPLTAESDVLRSQALTPSGLFASRRGLLVGAQLAVLGWLIYEGRSLSETLPWFTGLLGAMWDHHLAPSGDEMHRLLERWYDTPPRGLPGTPAQRLKVLEKLTAAGPWRTVPDVFIGYLRFLASTMVRHWQRLARLGLLPKAIELFLEFKGGAGLLARVLHPLLYQSFTQLRQPLTAAYAGEHPYYLLLARKLREPDLKPRVVFIHSAELGQEMGLGLPIPSRGVTWKNWIYKAVDELGAVAWRQPFRGRSWRVAVHPETGAPSDFEADPSERSKAQDTLLILDVGALAGLQPHDIEVGFQSIVRSLARNGLYVNQVMLLTPPYFALLPPSPSQQKVIDAIAAAINARVYRHRQIRLLTEAS